MRDGTRDTAIAFGSRVAVLVFGVAIQSALAWLLGPEGRGSYAVCLLFATVLGIVFSFGAENAGQYFVASGRMEPSRGVKASLLLLILGSALGVVVGRVLMLIDLELFHKAERSSFLMSLGIIPFVGLTNAFSLYFIAIRRFKWMAVSEVVNIGVHLLATLILVRGLSMGVDGALLAIIAAGMVSTVVSLALLRREGALGRSRGSSRDYLAMLSYGTRLVVARLSNAIHMRIGTMVLAFFVAASDIGHFAAASALAMLVMVIPRSVEKALFSRVAGDARGRPELVAQAARVSMLVSGAALALLCTFIVPAVRVLLSDEFLPVVPLTLLIAPGVLVRAATTVLIAYFTGTNRPTICSVAVGVGTIVNVIVLVVLLPALGLSGAAWAMTAGYVTTGVVLIDRFRRATGCSLRETWTPCREDWTLLLEFPRTLARGRG